MSALSADSLVTRHLFLHTLTQFACYSDEGELMSSVFVDDEAADVALLRSKTNPFQDVPHDKKATEVKEGLLQRKLHADVDGKRSECSALHGFRGAFVLEYFL